MFNPVLLNIFISSEDGYSALATGGYVVLAVVALLAVLAVAFFKKDKNVQTKFSTKQLVVCAVSLALAFATSYIKFDFPFGGSITLFSMFFICFAAYMYGPKIGFTIAFTYSILQFIQGGGSYILTPFQVCCDYFLAFTALGIAGFFKNKKNGLILGYLLSVFVRGVFHTLGGYLYWMDYMPETFPKSIAFLYPVVYNYGYLVPEAVLTVVVLLIPAVKAALKRCENMATE